MGALAVVTMLNDALAVATALTPLVQQMAQGGTVTEDDLRAALAGKTAALENLDRVIAEAEAAAKP